MLSILVYICIIRSCLNIMIKKKYYFFHYSMFYINYYIYYYYSSKLDDVYYIYIYIFLGNLLYKNLGILKLI